MTEDKVKFSITFKFFIHIVSIIVFVCLTLVFFFVMRSRSKLYQEIDKRGLSEAISLAYDATYGVLTEDEAVLNHLISGRINKPDIVYIKMMREDGTLLAEGKKEEGYDFLYRDEDNPVVEMEDGVSRSLLISAKGENVYEFIAPIMTEKFIDPEKKKAFEDAIFFTEKKREPLPPTIGTVKVNISLKNINKEIDETILISIAIIVIVATISVFVSYYFITFVVKPIKRVTQVALEVSKGDLEKSVDVKSSDEIGQLAASFNKMTRDLKAMTQELTNSKEYVEDIIKSMTDTLIVINPDTTIRTVNQATLDLLGYKKYELIGKTIKMIVEEDELFKRQGIEDLIKKGFISGVEKTYLSKNGKKVLVLFSGAVMRDEQRNVQGIVCVAQDITERRRLEEERDMIQLKMMQSSKLASLGEVAAGVAHEINQPLSYISSVIQCLQIDLNEDRIDKNELDNRLTTSFKQVGRINSIIQHLRTFGRRDDIAKRPISMETVLNNTLLLMGEQIRLNNIKLVKNIKSGLPMVLGSMNQLEQVFINLFQNALDVVGKISMDRELLVDMLLSRDKESVIIKVKDNGDGIKPEYMDKIFEPFFTTKEVGKGTGLGLSIIYGIIREHDGTITCESEVNKGTAFTITLPVVT